MKESRKNMKKILLASITLLALSSTAFAESATPVVSGVINGSGKSVSGTFNSTFSGTAAGTSSSGSEFMNNFSMAAGKSPASANFTSNGYAHNVTGYSTGTTSVPQTFSTSTHTNTTNFNTPAGMKTSGEVLSGANGTTNYSLTGKVNTDLGVNSFSGKGAEDFTNTGNAKLPDYSGTGSTTGTTTNTNTGTSTGNLSSVPYYNSSGYANLTGASVLGSVAGKNGTFYILGTGTDLQGNNATGNYFNQFGNDQSTVY